MTQTLQEQRTEFIKSYATHSRLSAKWAELGFIEIGGSYRFAVPCDCEETMCRGWQMVGYSAVPDVVMEQADRIDALERALEAAVEDLEQAILTQIAAGHHGLASAASETIDQARAALAKIRRET